MHISMLIITHTHIHTNVCTQMCAHKQLTHSAVKMCPSHTSHCFNLLPIPVDSNVYQVRDYCQRNALHTEVIESGEKSKLLPQGAVGLKNLFLLALLSNHEGKQVEIILSAKSE